MTNNRRKFPARLIATLLAGGILSDEGRVLIADLGHYPPHHHTGQLLCDPKFMTRLNGGDNALFPVDIGLGDLAIAIGYSFAPGTDWRGELNEMRFAKYGVGWGISSHDTKRPDLRRRDILVDKKWPPSNALAKIPGYDARIGPASGVSSEAIMWAITA